MPSPPSFASNQSSESALPLRYDLLGVWITILNIPEAVQRIVEAVETAQKGYVCVTGMHGIMEARDDAKLQNIINSAFLCTPDGMPTVWLGKVKGYREMDRVYGPDLVLAVMEYTRHKPIRHFFYGGAEGVASDLKVRMESRFPGVQIVGTYCPPFRALNSEEREELLQLVAMSKADIIWVGLSTPKQERFMAEFLPLLPVKVMLGVGAAFDFHTGRAKQAPRWMQRSGLEWFFRLITEPRRLGRRYMIQVPRFAMLLSLDWMGLISHSSARPEMPPAYHLLEYWPRTAAAGLILGLMGAFAVIWQFRGATGELLYMALLFVPMLAFLLSVFFLHVSSEEERLDRLAPLVLLLLALLTGALAIMVPVGTIAAAGFGSLLLHKGLILYGALAAGIPLLIYVGCLSACLVCSLFRRH